MPPSCPKCGSRNTSRLDPPTMKPTKDYTCDECGHSWNDNTGRGFGPHSDQRSY